MNAKNFEKTIKAFQKRAPFQSFTVELISGSTIHVDHPEALIMRGGVAVYLSATGVPTLFDHESVAQVTSRLGERAA